MTLLKEDESGDGRFLPLPGARTICGQPSCHHFACGWQLAVDAAQPYLAALKALERELSDIRARQDALITPDHSQARRLLVQAGLRNRGTHG